ncbi:MAG: hypothetical protein RJB66_1140 [Pseudomonadota bacterium]
MKSLIFAITPLSSFYMCGVIWVIQLIQYPSFLVVSQDHFVSFHARHSAVMGLLVGPVMILELVSALSLVWLQPHLVSIINLAMVVGLWLLTFFVSVPLHNQLSLGFSTETINRLIETNWPRTFLWTSKAILVLWWFEIKKLP